MCVQSIDMLHGKKTRLLCVCVLQIVAGCVLATLGAVLMTASKSSLLYLWELKQTAPLNQWSVKAQTERTVGVLKLDPNGRKG